MKLVLQFINKLQENRWLRKSETGYRTQVYQSLSEGCGPGRKAPENEQFHQQLHLPLLKTAFPCPACCFSFPFPSVLSPIILLFSFHSSLLSLCLFLRELILFFHFTEQKVQGMEGIFLVVAGFHILQQKKTFPFGSPKVELLQKEKAQQPATLAGPPAHTTQTHTCWLCTQTQILEALLPKHKHFLFFFPKRNKNPDYSRCITAKLCKIEQVLSVCLTPFNC